MEITKIKHTPGQTEIEYLVTLPGGGQKDTTLKTPEAPNSFMMALFAFQAPFVKLLKLKEWKDTAKVTTLNLSRSKTGARAVVVTLVNENDLVPGVSVVNSPLMRTSDDSQSSLKDGYFGADIAEMLATVEAEARKLINAGPIQQDLMPDSAPATE